MGKYSVRFTGFNTEEQALEFASWYEGSGEQDFDFEDGGSALTDMEDERIANGFHVDDFWEVIVPIKVYLDE